MRKLFSSLCVLIFVAALCFSSCSPVKTSESSNNASEWVEVQSITYSIKDGSEKKLTSTVYRKISDRQTITEEEFENAPEEQKEYPYSLDLSLSILEIPVNRNEFLKQEQEKVGNTIYSQCPHYSELYYFKSFMESYETRYVKIHLLDDGSIKINYYETLNALGFTTINVLPVSYEITYFKD